MANLNNLLWEIKRIAQHRVTLTDQKIAKIYGQLMDDLSGFLATGYRKYANSDGRLYLSDLDANRQRASFLQQIVDSVDNLHPQIVQQMESLIDATYSECFKGMYSSVMKANTRAEVARILKDINVNPYTFEATVKNNISRLTLPPVMQAHRAQTVQQIQQELTIGLANGDRYETMTNRIADRIGVSKSKADNIVRTETHRNVEGGFMDCAENLQSGLSGSGLIYAATWRNMKDERVRPQVRKKVNGKWKTYYNKNGANHIIMEGQTVKAGDPFDLGYYNGRKVQAKAPGQSGIAAHDCRCRCFLEYNLMTYEEFAKATGLTVEQVRKKYG